MTISIKRAAVALVLTSGTWGLPSHVVGQAPTGPIGALLTFVREDVRRSVPPEMRPYEVGRLFVSVSSEARARDALGTLEERQAEGLGVTLVEHSMDAGLLLEDERGQYVRDDGLWVAIGSVDDAGDDLADHPEDALAITLSYFVTYRRPATRSMVCLVSWRIVVRPTDKDGSGWEVVETRRKGTC